MNKNLALILILALGNPCAWATDHHCADFERVDETVLPDLTKSVSAGVDQVKFANTETYAILETIPNASHIGQKSRLKLYASIAAEPTIFENVYWFDFSPNTEKLILTLGLYDSDLGGYFASHIAIYEIATGKGTILDLGIVGPASWLSDEVILIQQDRTENFLTYSFIEGKFFKSDAKSIRVSPDRRYALLGDYLFSDEDHCTTANNCLVVQSLRDSKLHRYDYQLEGPGFYQGWSPFAGATVNVSDKPSKLVPKTEVRISEFPKILYFQHGKRVLDPCDVRNIRALSEISDSDERDFIAIGHADGSGDENFNLRLAKNRADHINNNYLSENSTIKNCGEKFAAHERPDPIRRIVEVYPRDFALDTEYDECASHE